jgi:hypothetical protein
LPITPHFPYNIPHDTHHPHPTAPDIARLLQPGRTYHLYTPLKKLTGANFMDIPDPILIIFFGFVIAIMLLVGVYEFTVLRAVLGIFPEKYPAHRPINPKCWLMGYAFLGRWKFNFALRVCADSGALHFFPLFHLLKPFSIPWHEITGQKGPRFSGSVQLYCKKTPDIPISITRRFADKLIRASENAWQYRR